MIFDRRRFTDESKRIEYQQRAENIDDTSTSRLSFNQAFTIRGSDVRCGNRRWAMTAFVSSIPWDGQHVLLHAVMSPRTLPQRYPALHEFMANSLTEYLACKNAAGMAIESRVDEKGKHWKRSPRYSLASVHFKLATADRAGSGDGLVAAIWRFLFRLPASGALEPYEQALGFWRPRRVCR